MVRISTHGWVSLSPESCMQSMGLQKLEVRDSYACSVVPLGKLWLEVRFQKAAHLWLCRVYTAPKYSAKGETGGSNPVCPLLANTLAVLCLGAQPRLVFCSFFCICPERIFFLDLPKGTVYAGTLPQSSADSVKWEVVRMQCGSTTIPIETPATLPCAFANTASSAWKTAALPPPLPETNSAMLLKFSSVILKGSLMNPSSSWLPFSILL